MKLQSLQSGVQVLLSKRAIVPVPWSQRGEGFHSILFLVPKPVRTFRPILDLKDLNSYVLTKPFRMVTLQSIIPLVRPGDFLMTLDLQDAYFHVPIHLLSQRFLRFTLGPHHFHFQALTFGLAKWPRMFTKLLAPVVTVLQLQGVSIFPYLDDWLFTASSFSKAQQVTALVTSTLKDLGVCHQLDEVPLGSISEEEIHWGCLPHSVWGSVSSSGQSSFYSSLCQDSDVAEVGLCQVLVEGSGSPGSSHGCRSMGQVSPEACSRSCFGSLVPEFSDVQSVDSCSSGNTRS